MLNREIDSFLTAQGVNCHGYANLNAEKGHIDEYYGEVWAKYPRAVSFGVYYPRQVLEQINDAPTHTYLYYYQVINTKLDEIALNLTGYLEGLGYLAFPVPASQRVGDRLDGIFSHRLAARLAGLGWIGKSGSLINQQVGPGLRLATVLTDAPLKCGEPIAEGCGACTICTDVCPPGAIKGQNWRKELELKDYLDVYLCDAHLQEMRQSFGKRICGICIAACPYGRKNSNKS